MSRPSLFRNTLSTVAIAAILSGCAVGQQHQSSFAAKVDQSKIGLAMRAQDALAAQQFATAVDFAEKAVANTPDDAGFRALLGNCYFAAGRFVSAEQAYRDSLTLMTDQPKIVLKLALVEIAQGKDSQALTLLDAAKDALDPADYGLALALAGRASDAVEVLNQVAREPGADARVRQNLALAYGLSGDWTMAKTVAAQDVAPDQLDSRIQQWMAMATPSKPSDQVAMLTGVKPAADPGQPQRLALRNAPMNQALAQVLGPKPQPQPQPVQQAQPEQKVAAIPAAPPPALPDPVPAPAPAVAEAAPPPPPVDVPAHVVAEAAKALLQPTPKPAAEAPKVVAAAVEKPVPDLPTRFDAPKPASYVAISDTVRRAADRVRRSSGNANAVVQLGAYGSPQQVMVAWNQITKRYPALRDYTPLRARFDGPKGTFWRLSIKGFGSRGEAASRCELLQSRGGKCFVRTFAGDAPVQLASR
jgi:Flp pilus assembly protein TadD